jgi:type VI secretion system secreted protein VgrG
VPDIIREVLQGAGLSNRDFRWALQEPHEPKIYSVQYRESDWAFVTRLMEEEGIFHYFAHSEDNHVLVMGDSPMANEKIASETQLRFRPDVGLNSPDENVFRFRFAEELRSGKVTLRDYAFENPNLSMEASTEAEPKELEVYDYPGEYVVPEQAKSMSQRRLQAFVATRAQGVGESNCNRICAGGIFELADHPATALNQSYMVLEVEHEGSEAMGSEADEGAGGYSNRFTVIPEGVPFRPLQVTPKPTPRGVQTAIVVGPSGEEIYCDEHGRVKVQFHWDRLGRNDEHSSCWIRVSQGWAGAAWGAMHIPRIGQEVIVDFIEGDPDRPIITGRVYHGANVPPYVLPAEKTKSTVKSNTTPGGGGSNELRFEDKKAQEEVYLHAQKDFNTVVENNRDQKVVNNETLWVGHNRDKKVDAFQTEYVGADKKIEVGGEHTENIGSHQTIEVGGDATHRIGGDHEQHVKGKSLVKVDVDREENIGVKRTLMVGADSNESVSGSKTETVDGNSDLTIKGNGSRVVNGDLSEDIGKVHTVEVGDQMTITCGSSKVSIKKDGTMVIEGKDITIKASDPVLVDAGKVDVKSKGKVTVKGGEVVLKGSAIAMN